VHEYAHGKVAEYFGDPTPRLSGRLTLNPLAHIDPIGLLMMVLIRFGWAKPVPVNPNYFKDPERDMAFVGLAGPAMNFFVAWVISLIAKFVSLPAGDAGNFIAMVIQYSIWINLALGVFNLIPIPPLDGSRLLRAVLPYEQASALDRIEPYGFYILIFILFFPGTSELLMTIVTFFYNVLMR
jgi:Zn-dependent protease